MKNNFDKLRFDEIRYYENGRIGSQNRIIGRKFPRIISTREIRNPNNSKDK